MCSRLCNTTRSSCHILEVKRSGLIVGQRKGSSPGAYVNPSTELSRNGGLIFLDIPNKLVQLLFPTIFLRVPDGFELDLGGLDAFLQAFDLVDRQSRLSEEQIAHGDV